MTRAADAARPPQGGTILVMAALAIGVHLTVNAFSGYGYFRDELYYIACSKRLAAGYVDQPVLTVYSVLLDSKGLARFTLPRPLDYDAPHRP